MTNNYNLYEVFFFNGYSICIKSVYDNAENQEHNEELNKFLAADIAQFGIITNIIPINYEKANRFFDLSNFDNWPVFGYTPKLQDPWFIYELGDTYHNNNGEDYIILAMDKDKDKMILAKKSKKGDKNITFFIGAKGIYMHSWSFGHYFMQNFEAACEWFNKEDEDNMVTVEQLVNLYADKDFSSFAIWDKGTLFGFSFIGGSIPEEFKDCKVLKFIVYDNWSKEQDEVDSVYGIIAIQIDGEANGIDVKDLACLYESSRIMNHGYCF